MKDDRIFEKAAMDRVILPLAGFAASSALVLLIVFFASYCGAFTQMKGAVHVNEPSFTEPDKPNADGFEYDYNDGVRTEVELRISSLRYGNGTVRYDFKLENTGEQRAVIKSVNCSLYTDGIAVGSYVLCNSFELLPKSGTAISGSRQTNGSDTATFTVTWEDEYGAKASKTFTTNVK